jgi:SNF2 family DNA or RNA helicase
VTGVLKPHPFQREAIMQLYNAHHPETDDRSSLIADDMGLGKTIEAILLDTSQRNKHQQFYTAKTLIVTQTSVTGSWKDHYEKWMPQLRAIVLDRKNRSPFLEALKAPTGSRSGHHVFICHWQVLRFISDELAAVQWFSIIGDEIHNIKNRKAQQTQVFKKLKTYYKTGLSGTWADNHPQDAWSVLNWLWPKTFSSYWGYIRDHVLEKKHTEGTCEAEGCESYHRRSYSETVGVANPEIIHAKMGQCYIRRLKEQVWKDLPEKTYEDRYVDLDPKQRKTYDDMAEDMLAWVGKHEDQPIAASMVVSQLVRLQQFAVAYARTRSVVKSGEVLEQVVLDEPSTKLDAVMDIIGATNAQIVVFGQSKQAINLLAARLVKAKIPHGVLTGDTKQADRDLAIQQFQAGKLRVFLSTIKAGGVGITLTAATICVFLDRAWSPSQNKQAEDRLHRLGQKNAVHIITLVARDTIDRSRNDKIDLKWTWLKQILEPARRK